MADRHSRSSRNYVENDEMNSFGSLVAEGITVGDGDVTPPLVDMCTRAYSLHLKQRQEGLEDEANRTLVEMAARDCLKIEPCPAPGGQKGIAWWWILVAAGAAYYVASRD
jgi:hypothetical protein